MSKGNLSYRCSRLIGPILISGCRRGGLRGAAVPRCWISHVGRNGRWHSAVGFGRSGNSIRNCSLGLRLVVVAERCASPRLCCSPIHNRCWRGRCIVLGGVLVLILPILLVRIILLLLRLGLSARLAIVISLPWLERLLLLIATCAIRLVLRSGGIGLCCGTRGRVGVLQDGAGLDPYCGIVPEGRCSGRWKSAVPSLSGGRWQRAM